LIYIDDYPGRYRGMLSHHLFSDIPGPAGEKELIEFAESIGMDRRWIQKQGTFFVHFDCMAGMIPRAKAAGAAEVSFKKFVKVKGRKK